MTTAVEASTPQPAPRPGGRSVTDDLVTFLLARREAGTRKYGTELLTGNGRDAHLDALQELLDLFVYLHQAQMERADLEAKLAAAEERAEQLNRDLAETRAELERERGRR